MARYAIEILQKYYPGAYDYLLIYNLPWILRSFVPIFKLIVRPNDWDRINFANGTYFLFNNKITKSINLYWFRERNRRFHR